MALATQCPHCHTIFKVAHDQLKLRAGLVRCGACKQIFNGIEHLVPPDRLNAPAPLPSQAAPAAPPATAAVTPAPVAPSQTLQAAPPSSTVPVPPAPPVNKEKSSPPAAADDPLEFAQIDDPETQTRIWSPAAKPSETPEEPLEDLGEDPLTRMTLVDFSAFEDDEDVAPAKDQATSEQAKPAHQPSPLHDHVEPADDAALDAHIWPNTAGGLVEAKAASPEQADSEPDAYLPPAPAALQPEPAQDFLSEQSPVSQIDTETEINANTEIDLADEADLPAEENLSDTEEPGFVVRERRRQRLRSITRIFMAVASVILLLTALAQGAYAFRDQIAAWFPQYKPLLADYCRLIGCQVKLPAQIDMVSIESSELQAQAANKNVFTLTLLLHNRSEVSQAWPYIELTLNDSNEKPLVRRILAPREYLANEKDAARGFAALSEQPVSVSFELLQLQASGYRVYLFYP